MEKNIYIYICITESTWLYSRQKLTQHCKSILLQLIFIFKDMRLGTFQVRIQQLGIHLPVPRKWVQSLVREKIPHATGQRSRCTTDMHCWIPRVPEPVPHTTGEATTMGSLHTYKGGPCSLQLEKAGKQEWWLSTAAEGTRQTLKKKYVFSYFTTLNRSMRNYFLCFLIMPVSVKVKNNLRPLLFFLWKFSKKSLYMDRIIEFSE